MSCIYCVSDFHELCVAPTPEIECCCPDEEDEVHSLVKLFRDDVSTGRKRAEKASPIMDGDPCAWAGLRFAGGGVIPITGCRPEEEMIAVARHHGPDKSTMNNSPNNLSNICVRCHNRWHTRNDEYYGVRPGQGVPFLPKPPMPCLQHDAVSLAEESDYASTELYWSTHRVQRAKPEHLESENLEPDSNERIGVENE